jgi:hypothetical protein
MDMRFRKPAMAALCAVIIGAYLFGGAFVAANAAHHCADGECDVCLQIHSVQSLLASGALPATMALSAAARHGFAPPRRVGALCLDAPTPVSFKVRLNY